MDEEDLSLQITPSFKSRNKGKGRSSAATRTPLDSPAGSGDESKLAAAASGTSAIQEDDDLDEGNSSAILFRKSNKASKARSSGIGAASTAKKASSGQPGSTGGSSSSRSKLSLSFAPGGAEAGGEEDEEANSSSVVRGNGSSRKLKRAPGIAPSTDRNLSQSMSQASLSSTLAQSSAPSYSKDDLAQLMAANASASSAVAPSNGSSKYDSLTMSKFGHRPPEADQEAAETLLPTESAIASAKARRETARKLGVDNMASSSADFISLEVGMPTSKRESRLVREEDEIGEGEDDHAQYTGADERVPLGKKGRQALEKRRKDELRGLIDDVMGEEEDGPGANEDDEEAREWEMAQIRRGAQRSTREDANDKAPYRAAPIPEVAALPSLLSVSNRLQTALSEARASKVDSDSLLEQAERERSELDKQEQELRGEVERVNTKHEWFIEFKTWVEEVASFLDEKFPVLEKIETDNVSVQKERLAMITKRRFEDDSDDVAAFTGLPIPVTVDNPADQQNSMDVDKQDEESEVDEMGRSRRENNLEPNSYARRTRREERKKRRPSPSTSVEAGYETDDGLLASDSQDLIAAKEAMSSDLTGLFADVQAEEFREPSLGIRPKFEDWKHRYGEEYGNAFGGLAMVGVWEFWARCELATWNPFGVPELQAPPHSLDGYKWHQALSAFQHARAESAGANGADQALVEEDDVVNGMITTVVIPRLRKLAVEAFDPFSGKAASRALAVVEELTYCLDTSHPRFEYLVMSFVAQYRIAAYRLRSYILPHLKEIRQPSSSTGMEGITARQAFLHRCLKLLTNALRWRKYTKQILLPAGQGGEGVGAGQTLQAALVHELVERTMLPVIEAGWETGGSELASRVTALLPREAFPVTVLRRLSRN